MRAPLAFPVVLVLALLGGCAADLPQLAQSVDPPRLEVPLAPKAPDGHRLKGAGVEDTVRSLLRRMFGAPIRVPTTPTDGYLMTYDSTTGTWDAEAPPSVSESDTLATVLARGATSGANNPTVDNGQRLNFARSGNGVSLRCAGDSQLDLRNEANNNGVGMIFTINSMQLSSSRLRNGSGSVLKLGANNNDYWQIGTDGTLSSMVDGTGTVDVGTGRFQAGASVGSPVGGIAAASSGLVIDRGTAGTFGNVQMRGLLLMGSCGYAGPANGAAAGGSNLFGIFGQASRTSSTNAFTLSTSGSYQAQSTSTVANNTTSWIPNNAATLWQADNLPLLRFKFAVQDVAEVRFFAGLVNSSTASDPVTAADPASVRECGLMFDTSRPDTHWEWVEDDNTTQTLTDTGVTPGIGTVYWLEIDLSAVNSFTMTLYSSSWSVLSTRTVTSSPFAASTGQTFDVALRNLGSTDAKELDFYHAAMVLRVGTP